MTAPCLHRHDGHIVRMGNISLALSLESRLQRCTAVHTSQWKATSSSHIAASRSRRWTKAVTSSQALEKLGIVMN
eukprot:3677278-Amphidinium_carterae.2